MPPTSITTRGPELSASCLLRRPLSPVPCGMPPRSSSATPVQRPTKLPSSSHARSGIPWTHQARSMNSFLSITPSMDVRWARSLPPRTPSTRLPFHQWFPGSSTATSTTSNSSRPLSRTRHAVLLSSPFRERAVSTAPLQSSSLPSANAAMPSALF